MNNYSTRLDKLERLVGPTAPHVVRAILDRDDNGQYTGADITRAGGRPERLDRDTGEPIASFKARMLEVAEPDALWILRNIVCADNGQPIAGDEAWPADAVG